MVRRIWKDGVEGGTPLSAAALNEMEEDLQAGRDFHLKIGSVETGAAGASLGDRQEDNSQELNLQLPALDSYGWLVACFLDNGEHGEKLNLYYSPDGKQIFGGQNNPAYGVDRLRDPSIIYFKGTFYVAYTLSDGVGRNFRVISSPTGAPGTWTLAATVSVSNVVATGDKCWAPELVVDGEDVYVFFTWQKAKTSETTSGAGNGVLSAMGWVKANTPSNGLKTWGTPQLLSAPGFPTAFIDGVPIQLGQNWYLFASGGSQIYRGKGTSITGPYTLDKSGNWAGWGTGIEGPYITKIHDTYRIYYDRYVGNLGHWFSESTDLNTWSTPEQVTAAPGVLPPGGSIRHGSFLQLPNMDAAVKALAATTAPSSPASAVITQGKVIPNGTQVAFDGSTVVDNPNGMLRGADGTGSVYLAQGGTYLVTMKCVITAASGTASRFFIQYDDGGSGIYGRVPMGGVGEDQFTGSFMIVGAPMNARVRTQGYHLQGANRSVVVTTTFTKLGA